MASDVNENNRKFLDEAAKVFRDQLTPGSRFAVLLDSATPAGMASNITGGTTAFRRSESAFSPSSIHLLCTKRLSRSLEPSLPQIGDMPPQPPTMRARIGALLVSVVRRALFWYTGQIRTFQSTVADAAREQALVFQDIDAQQRHCRAQINELVRHVKQLERQIQEMREGEPASFAEATGEAQRPREEHRIGSSDAAAGQDPR